MLECVGKGGSSKVFKVISPEHKIYALKRIKLQGREREAAMGFKDEITLLKRLKGRHHIVQLIDSDIIADSGVIYMILEYGEVDLARLLQRREKAREERERRERAEGHRFVDLNFIRLHWQQMLEAVDIIHEERIVHSDLKPANFLFVEGTLKLIDFGIAKAIQNDTTHIARESQVGTLNYMSPEAILSGSGNTARGSKQAKVGRASDVWSLGCILYQMVYGHTPFSHLQFIQKLHPITDPNHLISFPELQDTSLMDVLKRCLDRNPKTRIGMGELLSHRFLHPSPSPFPHPSFPRAPSSADAGGKASVHNARGEVGTMGMGMGMGAGGQQITPELLNSMLTQISSAAAHGQSSTDLSKISEELCRMLVSGKVPANAGAAALPSAAAGTTGGPPPPPPPAPPAPPPPPPPKALVKAAPFRIRKGGPGTDANGQMGKQPSQQGGQHGGELAAAVAAKARARSEQRQEALRALESKGAKATKARGHANGGDIAAAVAAKARARAEQRKDSLRALEDRGVKEIKVQKEGGDELQKALLVGLHGRFSSLACQEMDDEDSSMSWQ